MDTYLLFCFLLGLKAALGECFSLRGKCFKSPPEALLPGYTFWVCMCAYVHVHRAAIENDPKRSQDMILGLLNHICGILNLANNAHFCTSCGAQSWDEP